MLSQWTNRKGIFGPSGINANHFFSHSWLCVQILLSLKLHSHKKFIESDISGRFWLAVHHGKCGALFVTANVLITVWWIIPFICWREHCHSVGKQPFHCRRCAPFPVTWRSSAVPSVCFWKFWLWKWSARVAFKWQPVWFNVRVFWQHQKNNHMLQWCMIALSKTQKS